MAISPSNNQTVLITGINGYIASVLGLHLLKAGYSLRGTARRISSTDLLLKGPYAPYIDRVKIYEVPDITIPGAFDEAVKDVDGIFHTASPVNFSLTSYTQTVDAAVSGTNTLLHSALQSGPLLKTVVITSSVAAVVNLVDEAYTFTESDYASKSLAKAQLDLKEGRQSPGGILYGASKTAAEQAVWKFRDEQKPKWALTTINPSVVIGTPVALPESGEKLNETLRPLYRILAGTTKSIPPTIGVGGLVDVSDVAYMHTWAYEHPEKSDGQRYIACAGSGPVQAQADILRDYLRERGDDALLGNIPLGNPGEGYVGYNKETAKVESVGWAPGKPRVSGEKAEREMGFKYKGLLESVAETAEALRPLLRGEERRGEVLT
ncbi:hypothetical protein DSL72_005186 [Monilinia vaccinii-corymbosi]|uniref:NAD-dependent epimerase/dehydratase domain-containing protein n=1 Tax=Monilinia vaccinii-corymbosi TaxID=61207 RepID=A0A8A3PEP2_9HELO|nr:hypothetical protein DSL72_005186 [Monilinia vaccinii-corymbosi]